MKTLIVKEIKSFYKSRIANLFVLLFLIINSLFIWIIRGELNIFTSNYSSLSNFFFLAPILLIIFIPAITMRSFSHEFSNKTINILLTKPITYSSIVFSKFISYSFLVILSILPTIIYVFSIFYIAESSQNIDIGEILGSYTGLFLVSIAFVSISIYCSSITEKQIISFVLSLALNLIFFYLFDYLNNLLDSQFFLKKIGLSYHYKSFSNGIIYISDLSWTKKIKHPSELFSIGDKIDVIVLELDVDERKLSLGHKQTKKNPWDDYLKKYPVDSIHSFKLESISERGGSIFLNDDLSAFVPKKHTIKEDGSSLKDGEEADFKVIEFNSDFKRIVMSHSATYKKEPEKKKAKTKSKIENGDKSTLGDIEALADLKKKMDENKDN